MKDFFKSALKRALWTMAEVALGLLETTVLVTDIDIPAILNVTIMSGIISMLKSISVGMPEVSKNEK